MNNVYFDTDKISLMKKAYEKAKEKQQESFMFDGDEYLTAYAKYLLQYLEQLTKIEGK